MNLPSEQGNPYYVPEVLRNGTVGLTEGIPLQHIATAPHIEVANRVERLLTETQSLFTGEQAQKIRDDVAAANTAYGVLSAWGLNLRDCALANGWTEPSANT